MLTDTQKDEFRIGMALLYGIKSELPRARLIESGDELLNHIVETHETFSDFVRAHGRPTASCMTPAGLEIHEWTRVQFRKGQQRGTLSLMEFGSVSASAFSG